MSRPVRLHSVQSHPVRPTPSRPGRARAHLSALVGALTVAALALTGCSSSTTATAPAASASAGGSPRPSGSATGSPSVTTGPYGVGAPVTDPSCAAPPSQWKTFKAPDKVVADLPELESGTNHSKAAERWTYPASEVHQWMTSPATAPKGPKLVFLTFDDGPDKTVTAQELTNLEKGGVPATFFMITPQMQGVPVDLLRRSLRDGNGLGVHSYSHDYRYLFKGDAAQRATHVACDYDWALAQARAILGSGYAESGFRYPGGHMSWNHLGQADAELARRGVVPIDWNAMSGDADAQMPTTVPGYLAMVKKSIAEAGNPRVVVLLNHDNKERTAEAMPSIIAWLKSQHYQFGIIS
ncbi:polysaccharide deacetylase [Acidipropionibacterium jensenii]|nr:polysaccharide deacetylase [Acidipropionibacterium jensenii]